MQRIPGEEESKEPEDRYEANVLLAKEALTYCRKIIPEEGGSFTTATSNIFTLYNKVVEVRNKKLKLSEYLPHVLIGPYDGHLNFLARKEKVKKSKQDNVGNCQELAILGMNYLRKKNVRRIEEVAIVNGDHVFVVIDREGDINDRSTWGKSCVILDVLDNKIYSPSEINIQLKGYHFDYDRMMQGLDPHSSFDFTDASKLIVQNEYLRRVDPAENKKKLDDFYKTIDLIMSASAKYLDETKFAELNVMIDQIKKETDEDKINKLSNFTLERLLVKPIKKMIKLIEPSPDHGTIFNEILMNSQNKETALEVAIHLHLSKEAEVLLDRGADPYAVNGLNYTLFDVAVKNGDLEIVKLILDRDAKENLNIDRPQKNGPSALWMAIDYNQIKIVEELLKRDANPHLMDQYGSSPWHYAARIGNVEIINLISDYQTKGINYQKSDGWTALHLAVSNKYYQMAKDLLFLGASPYIANQDGFTPWHMAAKDGDLQMIKLILERDAKEKNSIINYQKSDGWTALHLAVANGHYQVVEELLKQGADPNLQSFDQVTPFKIAERMQNQNPAMLNLLKSTMPENQNTSRLQKK